MCFTAARAFPSINWGSQGSFQPSCHVSWISPSKVHCTYVTLIRFNDTYLSFVVEVLVEIVAILLVIRIQHLVYPLTLSFIPNMMLLKRFPHTHITLNNSLGNTIFPSQRLVTTSASLRTQTGLHCLILQVLNIKSLLPKCLIQFLSLLYVRI